MKVAPFLSVLERLRLSEEMDDLIARYGRLDPTDLPAAMKLRDDMKAMVERLGALK